jgi:hypothetical protein
MKLNFESSRPDREDTIGNGVKPVQIGRATANVVEPKGFRRLKFNELVSVGDYVEDESSGLQLWDGPRGFQAGSFVKPIYRPQRKRSVAPKKSK